jgi:zinc/manganese transport system substrate-binding protein
MRLILRFAAFAAVAYLTYASASAQGLLAQGASLRLVAAENFYGDIARQIAGDRAEVASIMSNPDQDPHLFETTPSVARSLADAQIVILNGADYDPWMEKLLKAAPRPGRVVINVADLLGRKSGDNPHLWYDPQTMPAAASAIADALTKADPAHRTEFESRLHAFIASLASVQEKIAAISAKYAGTPVTATEPVFGYMATALKLTMRNERFQLSVMNDTEPSARDLAAFENDLKTHKVKVLFYNKQVTDKLTKTLLDLARASHVNVVGITETQPAGTSFQDWMLTQLGATEKALAGPSS